MTPSKIHPVIMCGGEGTRLWPTSRKAMPKQFARLHRELSLLQTTMQRIEDSGYTEPLVITNCANRFSVVEQLDEIGVQGATIMIEPESRNTAPAVCAAAEFLGKSDMDALMLVLPSDHLVRDQLALASAVSAGVEKARNGEIVVFGIRPDRAETGFGYIELSDTRSPDGTPQPFLQFVEKPSTQGVEKMLHTGRYVWNAGIFLLSVRTARRLFEKYQPTLRSHVRLAIQDLKYDMNFARLGTSYCDAPKISLDHAIMEHETGIVVPVSPGWADFGSWRSVWEESAKDHNGVAASSNALAIECENSLLRSENEGVQVVGIGLRNITAVATRDAVLIADMDASQSVSLAVHELRAQGVTQADEFPRHDRPWGHYETLSLGQRFQVKSIVVKPGGKLSLQSHAHRAEHWVVVEGTATVTIGTKRQMISENQSVYIPLGEVHRLENEGKLQLKLIEVQTGCYLGEDDIVRYEDVYARA
ncbi:mannose-1-phosphate guanylyltransferase/mannose-6-phosphate isomerase [Arenibacterium sp. CAU 1754]